MTKDYYKILEISEFSSQEEIKKAYRLLARKFHPDIAGNSPNVVERFKEINEAYNLLSDDAKKQDYDKARKFYNYAKESSEVKKSYSKETTYPNYQKSSKKDNKKSSFWEDIFKTTGNNREQKVPKKGEDIYSDIEISMYESVVGTTKVINMLQTQVCPFCGGRKFVNGSTCSHCRGKGETSTYKKFNVKIPAGILNGSKIRLSNEGEKGQYGGKNGDLYLNIHVKENVNYKVDGLNILKTICIAPYEAVLGTNIKVATIIGNVSLKIAPNTRNGQKIRLSGCGIEQYNKVGDMIVTVEIQIPKNTTDEELYLYRRLQEISSISDCLRERLD